MEMAPHVSRWAMTRTCWTRVKRKHNEKHTQYNENNKNKRIDMIIMIFEKKQQRVNNNHKPIKTQKRKEDVQQQLKWIDNLRVKSQTTSY